MAAAYAALVPICEVPSGILADRWSRRGVLVVGNVCAFLSVLVGGISTDVATYLVAALLLGVYFAMQSGTFDALVYDTVLEETGSSDRFESILGRLRMAESAALVLGALGGGLLAAVTSTRVTYFATLPFLAASTVSLLAFREPRLHEVEERRSLRQHLSVTYGTLRHDVRLLPIAALLLLAAVLTQAVFEFGPLWLVDLESGAGLFGPAWALLMASLGIGGALGGRIRFDAPGPLAAVLAHPQFRRELDVRSRAQLVAQGVGERGPCTEYIRSTLAHMAELGVADAHLTRVLETAEAMRARADSRRAR
jgi:MFS family permease